MKEKLCVMIMLLIGMTSIMANGNNEAVGKNEKSKGKIEIRVMTRWTGADANAPSLTKLITEFNETNDEIVIVDVSISDEDSYNNKLRTSMATGDIPEIFYSGSSKYEYATNNVILDVTPYYDANPEWRDGFLPGAIEAVGRYPDLDGLYAVPSECNFEPFFYNKTLFKKAGINSAPETYEEFLVAIKKLNSAGIIPIGAGCADSWRMAHLYNGLFAKTVGLDKANGLATGKTKYTDPELVTSFQAFKDLVDADAFSEDFASVDYATEQMRFLSGESAMMYNGTWFVGNIVGSDIADEIGVFMMPSMSNFPANSKYGILYTGDLVMSNLVEDEAKKEAMITVMKHLTNANACDTFLEFTKKPAYRIDGTYTTDNKLLADIIELGQKDIGMIDADRYAFNAQVTGVFRDNLVAVALGVKTPEQVGDVLNKIMEQE